MRLINKSALVGRIEPAGNPTGTIGNEAKSGGSGMLFTSYKSKNSFGAIKGECGFEKPQAMKKGFPDF